MPKLGEQPFLDPLNIVVKTRTLDQQHIRRVAADIRRLAESRGHIVRRVDLPTPGEHPHAHVMGILLLAMSSFGFCILALSGVLVVNLMTALLASQFRQIAVMKAIGATRRQIAFIYLGETLLLGTTAILVGVPIGIVGGRQLSRLMAALLNFDIASFATPAWVYLLGIAGGMLVPLLATALPVWNASRVPVRLALADFGISQDAFGTSILDATLERIGGPARPLLLALRNNLRRPLKDDPDVDHSLCWWPLFLFVSECQVFFNRDGRSLFRLHKI
jgi:putative ABC transport system permease protein